MGAGVIGALADLQGMSVLPGDGWQGAVASGLIYTAVAFIVLFLVRLAIAPFQVHRDGNWYGSRFVYREPKLAYRAYVAPDTNNALQKFRFPDAPPFASINYKIVPEHMPHHYSIVVDSHPHNMRDFNDDHPPFTYGGGSFPLNKDRDIYLKTYLRQGSDPFSVRIYVHSWEELGEKLPPPFIN